MKIFLNNKEILPCKQIYISANRINEFKNGLILWKIAEELYIVYTPEKKYRVINSLKEI